MQTTYSLNPRLFVAQTYLTSDSHTSNSCKLQTLSCRPRSLDSSLANVRRLSSDSSDQILPPSDFHNLRLFEAGILPTSDSHNLKLLQTSDSLNLRLFEAQTLPTSESHKLKPLQTSDSLNFRLSQTSSTSDASKLIRLFQPQTLTLTTSNSWKPQTLST